VEFLSQKLRVLLYYDLSFGEECLVNAGVERIELLMIRKVLNEGAL
jgi:hypothetical protein